MRLKTFSSISLAFLLVVGVVGVASAQEVAATQGVFIRVDRPAANTWVAIGDSIKVRILCYDGRLDGGFQVAVVDSSVDDGDIGTTANIAEKIYYNVDETSTSGAQRVRAGTAGTSGVDTFEVTFVVAANTEATENFESASNHALKVVVDPDGEDPLNNLMKNKKITPSVSGFGATRVGDGKLFGVDAERPIHGTVFESIGLDLGRLNTVLVDTAALFSGQDIEPYIREIQIVTDQVFRAVLNLSTSQILNARADRIEVGLVPADSIAAYQETGRAFDGNVEGARAAAFTEDARVKLELRGDRLYSPNPSVDMKIAAGQFKDNERLELFAYLVDVAGNVGGTAAAPAAANWKALHGTSGELVGTSDNTVTGDPDLDAAADDDPNDDTPGTTDQATGVTIIGDATAPTITVRYPNPDSITAGSHDARISYHPNQLLRNYILLQGESNLGNRIRVRGRKVLLFDVSEVPDSIKISHGDSTFSLGSGAVDDPNTPRNEDISPTEADGGTPDSTLETRLPWRHVEPGGVQEDLKIEVWDSLGNMSSTSLPDIWYDWRSPRITNLFPTGEGVEDPSAPRNADYNDEYTINLATKDPAFRFDEELDSLSIRYHEVGGSKAIVQAFAPGNDQLAKVGEPLTWHVDDTTFVENQRYELQILAIDLVGNASATDGGTLTFTRGFGNPSADVFTIVPDADLKEKQVAGADYAIALSVIDTTLTRIEKEQDSAAGDVRAVTYRTPSALAAIVSGDQAGALEGVTFSGAGVSAAPSFTLPVDLAAAGMVAKAAILDKDGWHAGQRTVKFKSTKPLTDVVLYAAEGAIDPATGAYTLRISGQAAKPIDIQIAEFSKFTLTAVEGETSTGNVSGAFSVRVVPTDSFDNPSLRIDNNTGSKDYESVAFTFASSNAAVTVPSGQQMVTSIEGSTYGAVAANVGGSATISVRSVGDDYVTGTGDDATTGTLTGDLTVNIVSDDGPEPDPGAPAAPANIVVRDYLGADGGGDQGGIVVVSFPNSSQHEAVSHYQIFREIDSTTGLDDEGNVIELDEPVKTWMAWTKVSFAADAGDEMGDAEGDMQTVIVPAIDNIATNWGVTAVTAAGESEQTTASKRVFTKESIQQTLQLLGMPEAELLTDEELSNQFNAPEDYVKSLIGDRKNVIFAPVNPDLSALMGSGSVPANIRTSNAGKLLSSARTVTEEPVAAVDNIAPAAVTDATGEGAGPVVLRWTPSSSDGIVGSIPYFNYNVPIPGVKGYSVMRGASADDLEEIASMEPGSTRFTDDNLPDGVTSLVYRIDAFDDNNVATGELILVENISVRMSFVDANGDPVYLMVLPSQGGNLGVDFEDFVAFAAAFNSRKGDANYNPQADVDDDGTVDFSDYVTAAASFGRTAVVPAGSKLAVVPQRPGVNADTEMALQLASDKVLVGETVTLTVSMANASQLNGFGLELVYDADKFEFVSAAPADNDLLKSEGGETPLFKNWPEAGRVSVVNAIIESGSVSGEGALVTFTFKVLREFEDNARFEIAQGVVFDPDKLQNPVVTLGALDVQSTPTEFALHQNYPNPFNPQTNIPYDLAEGGNVVLRIYNLLGQEVRTLVRERQAPGRYTVQWSGMDDRGVSVSSGIYFYRVSVAGKFQDAKRLMLLK